jgi:hypothetical protein
LTKKPFRGGKGFFHKAHERLISLLVISSLARIVTLAAVFKLVAATVKRYATIHFELADLAVFLVAIQEWTSSHGMNSRIILVVDCCHLPFEIFAFIKILLSVVFVMVSIVSIAVPVISLRGYGYCRHRDQQ